MNFFDAVQIALYLGCDRGNHNINTVEWFNNRRLFSTLDYVSPCECEEMHFQQIESATQHDSNKNPSDNPREIPIVFREGSVHTTLFSDAFGRASIMAHLDVG